MILFTLSLILLLGVAPQCSAESINNTTVHEFDLHRYMGRWYEIARFDNRYEKNLTEVTAEYSIDENNLVTIINRGFNTENMEWQEARGHGEITDVLGRLKVSFFLFFSNEYNIMDLDEEYQWALVGSKSSKYLWILSRTPSLPTETLEHIISLAAQRGYNVKELNIIQPTDVAEW